MSAFRREFESDGFSHLSKLEIFSNFLFFVSILRLNMPRATRKDKEKSKKSRRNGSTRKRSATDDFDQVMEENTEVQVATPQQPQCHHLLRKVD